MLLQRKFKNSNTNYSYFEEQYHKQKNHNGKLVIIFKSIDIQKPMLVFNQKMLLLGYCEMKVRKFI